MIIPYIEYHNCPFKYVSKYFLFKPYIRSVTLLDEKNRFYNYSQDGYYIGLNLFAPFSFDKGDWWALRFKYTEALYIFLL
jgi:hypothetical protein